MVDILPKKEMRYFAGFAFLFTTLGWMINVGIFVADDLSDGKPSHFRFHLINEITGFYSVLILMPLLLWAFNRFPIKKEFFLKTILIHAWAVLVFGFCHTSLMTLSRKLIYFLIGLPAYNPGILKYRYLMEFQKQLLVYVFIYGIFFLFQYVRANHEQKIRTSQLEKQLTDAKLQALKMQLNPHFLFNTLNMISATMYDDIQKADQMIVRLSDILRITLNTGQAQLTELKDELKILDAYLKIMKARFEEQLDVSLDIEDNTLDALCPALCLQPLVENSIKHTMNQTADKITGKTIIGIQTRVSGRSMQIIITDNGPGLEGSMDGALKRGMGLKTTKERLDKLFGRDHEFDMKNRGSGGLEIRITLPLQYRDEV